MPDRAMAADTRELPPLDSRFNVMRDLGMTTSASLFGDSAISRSDLDGLFKVARGERHRMVPSIKSLGEIFGNKSFRSVTVIASCHRVVTGFLPGIVMGLHHMTVHTSFRVVGHIGMTFGINKGVEPQPDDHGK